MLINIIKDTQVSGDYYEYVVMVTNGITWSQVTQTKDYTKWNLQLVISLLQVSTIAVIM